MEKLKFLRVKRIEKDGKEVILDNIHFYYVTAQSRNEVIKDKNIMEYSNFRGVFRENLVVFGIKF